VTSITLADGLALWGVRIGSKESKSPISPSFTETPQGILFVSQALIADFVL
jgi:hypothetical protein